MKLPSLSSLVAGLVALLSSLILASCGGGGAEGNPSLYGPFQVVPNGATLYAGVPTTFQINGGRKPYQLTSSEATLLPVPTTVDGNSFTIMGNNPGVIDTGLGPNDLPVRSVTITARSGDGQSQLVVVKVAVNFLTGYGAIFSPSSCPASSGTASTGPIACAGGDTLIAFSATSNGNLHSNEAFRLTVIHGAAILVDPSTGANGDSIVLNSDETGQVIALMRVAPNTPTQIGVLRIQEVSTGIYHDMAFVISGNTSAVTLTAIPDTITFTGPDSATCGTGTADILVFDGTPPYNAVSSNTSLARVAPSSSSTQPGRFTITAGNVSLCGNTTIVFTDANGARGTATVNTAVGSATPPVPSLPLQVTPNDVTIACGQTVSAAITGGSVPQGSSGSPSYNVSSLDPNLTWTVATAGTAGATISVTRAGPVGPGTGTTTSRIQITDGFTFTNLTVHSPTTCP